MNRKLVFLIAGGLTFLLMLIQFFLPKEFDWRKNYHLNSNEPYGCEILYESLVKSTSKQNILIGKDPISDQLSEINPYTHYFFITQKFNPGILEMNELKNRIHAGATVFIAAEHFGENLQELIVLKTDYQYSKSQKIILKIPQKNIEIKHTLPYVSTFEYPLDSVLENDCKILLSTAKGFPVIIQVTIGSGNLFLCAEPDFFSNYFLMKGKYIKIGQHILTEMEIHSGSKLYWDEYYKPNDLKQNTSLRVILKDPALSMAWYLGMAGLLLFVFFESKRIQRVIPVLEPIKNTTVEFVYTIGKLFFLNADHKNIAEKKILFFQDFLRSKYGIRNHSWNQEWIEQVSNKSNLSVSDITALANLLQEIQRQPKLTDNELLLLNQRLQWFYQNRS